MLNHYRGGLDDAASGLPAVLDNPSALLNESEVAGLQERYEATAALGDPAFEVVLAAARGSLADAIAVVFVVAAVTVAASIVAAIALPELELQRLSPAEMARRAAAARAGGDAATTEQRAQADAEAPARPGPRERATPPVTPPTAPPRPPPIAEG